MFLRPGWYHAPRPRLRHADRALRVRGNEQTVGAVPHDELVHPAIQNETVFPEAKAVNVAARRSLYIAFEVGNSTVLEIAQPSGLLQGDVPTIMTTLYPESTMTWLIVVEPLPPCATAPTGTSKRQSRRLRSFIAKAPWMRRGNVPVDADRSLMSRTCIA
jgi:hypothetical protein